MAKNAKFPGAASHFKKAQRVYCTVDNEKHRIIVTDAYILLAMSEADYNDVMLPTFKAPAGNWTYNKGDATVTPSAPLKNMIKMLNDADGAKIEKSSIVIDTGRAYCRGYYNNQTVAFYDESLRACFSDAAELYTAGAYKPAIVVLDEIDIGLLLPIRANDNAVAAVRAACLAEEPADVVENLHRTSNREAVIEYKKIAIEAERKADEEKARADSLMDAAAELREKLAKKDDELAELKRIADADAKTIAKTIAEYEKKIAELEAAPKTKAPETKAEKMIADLGDLGDAKVTVRGTESSPTIYVQTERAEINRKLRAAGAHWDSRRKAYYIAA